MKLRAPTILSCLALSAAGGLSAEVIERVIVAVNGDIVTLSEFEARQLGAIQAARIGQDQIPAFLQENNARLLQEAVDELLVIQRADQLGLRLPPGAIDEVVRKNIMEQHKIANEAELQRQLRREGMTLDDLKRQIERSILHRQVLSTEIPPSTVTEAEARTYYDEHQDEFTRPATIKLAEIFVDADRPDALQRASELRQRAVAGEDFAVLARSESDAATAESGGDLGTLVLGEINPDIERIAGGLEPGGISEPHQTLAGYRILRLVERTDASVDPFETVKQKILGDLSSARRREDFESYVAKLREDAIIDVRVREVGLQLDAPTGPNLMEEARTAAEDAPAEDASAPEAGAEDDEFSVSGSSRPERVVPGQALDEPAPPQPPPPSVPGDESDESDEE
jgi:peptidyl-prolyl cis-trans isomerase SurA